MNNNCNVDGEEFAKLPHLKSYWTVGLTEGRGASALLRALAGSRELKVLALSNDALTLDDLKVIARLPNLTELELSGTIVSDDNLKELLPLKKLLRLRLEDCRITRKSLPTLKVMHANGLRALRLSGRFWPHSDMQSLLKVFPEADFPHDRFDPATYKKGTDWQELMKSVGP